jgi:hypothetical protein
MGRLHHSRGVEQSHKSRQVEGVLWNDTTLDEEKPEFKMIWKSRNGTCLGKKIPGQEAGLCTFALLDWWLHT